LLLLAGTISECILRRVLDFQRIKHAKPTSHAATRMTNATDSDRTFSSVIARRRTHLVAAVIVLVLVRAVCELSMVNQFRTDPQLPIWYLFIGIKLIFWLLVGFGAYRLLISLARKSAIVAVAFPVIWTLAILWSSWRYLEGGQALADAANPRATPQRLKSLATFAGIQAGYELDNRLATNLSTPAEVLRLLHGRLHQVGTEMNLAANPNTPADILSNLSKHQDEWVRRSLADNPQLPSDVVETLLSDRDEQVRQRLARNPRSSTAKSHKQDNGSQRE
jgi:hypothetical protein